jgi:hypothetical protein
MSRPLERALITATRARKVRIAPTWTDGPVVARQQTRALAALSGVNPSRTSGSRALQRTRSVADPRRRAPRAHSTRRRPPSAGPSRSLDPLKTPVGGPLALTRSVADPRRWAPRAHSIRRRPPAAGSSQRLRSVEDARRRAPRAHSIRRRPPAAGPSRSLDPLKTPAAGPSQRSRSVEDPRRRLLQRLPSDSGNLLPSHAEPRGLHLGPVRSADAARITPSGGASRSAP